MNCPLCVDQTLEITHRAGIEIDICPTCRGIWLDRGELDRLATSPTEPINAAPTPRGRDRTDGRTDDRTDGQEYGATTQPRRKSKKRRLADRLGDVLEEVLDL